MYKVKTDQTCVPFTRLVLPRKEVQPDPSSDDEEDILLEIKPSQRRKTTAPENITVTGGPISKLLPPPVLLPTAFSSRFITAPIIPSSPASTSLPTNTETPGASPAKAFEKRMADDGRELTSSIVKGRAASGLLDLMKAR